MNKMLYPVALLTALICLSTGALAQAQAPNVPQQAVTPAPTDSPAPGATTNAPPTKEVQPGSAVNPAVRPSPTSTEADPKDQASTQPHRSPTAQCDCSASKNDGAWTGKDVATILVGVLSATVAVIAVISNGISSRATAAQKANEGEVDALQSKLDNFYGPYLQLSSTNRLLATDLKNRHAEAGEMRVLLLLLDPNWKTRFKPGDIALVDEILSIDAKLLELIQDKSGLVNETVQPYLWRAASHFRIMKLAAEGKLDNDPERYRHYVYPKQLDEIIDLEIRRIHGRIDLIRKSPMKLHPPAADLEIPQNLQLEPWPGTRPSKSEAHQIVMARC